MELTSGQKEILLKHLQTSMFSNGCYKFGPVLRKDTRELYEVLNFLRIGHDASYVNEDNSSTNEEKVPLYVHVRFQQAAKLLKVLSAITGKSTAELTNGESEKVEPTATPTKKLVELIESPVKLVEKLVKTRGRPKKEKTSESTTSISKVLNINFDFSDMLKR